MSVGQDILADVTFTGDTKGGLPTTLMRPDTFDFSITEGEKDFGVPFQYDKTLKNFIIKRDVLKLNIGEKYKFRGIGINKGLSEPTITIPNPIKIDTIIISNITRSSLDGKHLTQVECRIYLDEIINNQAYFHFIPSNENNNVYQVKSFLKDQAAFKRLKNKPGFLVDYSRITDNEILLNLEIYDDQPATTLNLNMFNTTKSYYEFNHYMSNNIGASSYDSPPIAGFNIKSDKSYGTFSAKTGINEVIKLQ